MGGEGWENVSYEYSERTGKKKICPPHKVAQGIKDKCEEGFSLFAAGKLSAIL